LRTVTSLALTNKFTSCKWELKHLLGQVKEIEKDKYANENDSLVKIKIIREQITKVGMEIDSIKKEIMMLSSRNTN